MSKYNKKTVKLGDVLIYEQPSHYIVNDTKYREDYDIPVLTAGDTFILGYTNETKNVFSDLPVIIFDDFTTSTKYVDFPFKVKSSAMKILKGSKEVNLKYMYYLLSNIKVDVERHKRYWISQFSNIKVLLPEYMVQSEIAAVIDKVEFLITTRKKQLLYLDRLIKSQHSGEPKLMGVAM